MKKSLVEKFIPPSFVGYYRTSTTEQKAGLEAQKTAIKAYVKSQGGKLIGEFEEHMTGTKSKKRIEVYKAVALALSTGSTLVVHKIDRIARDLNFWQEIKRSQVKFLSLDNIGGSTMIANILMSVAESEQEWMKQRQRNAYSELRSNGVKLGKIENLTDDKRKLGRERSAAIRSEVAALMNSQIIGHICDYRSSGWTWKKISDRLNELNHRTVKGNLFFPNTIKQLHDKHCK